MDEILKMLGMESSRVHNLPEISIRGGADIPEDGDLAKYAAWSLAAAVVGGLIFSWVKP